MRIVILSDSAQCLQCPKQGPGNGNYSTHSCRKKWMKQMKYKVSYTLNTNDFLTAKVGSSKY